MEKKYPVRINKYLALKNYATRKEADELITKGLVFINNRKAILGDQVKENDKVTLSKKFQQKKPIYYAYNKPIGISTNKDSSAKDILSETKFPTKVFPVGRLDKDSHGLIIMTNDGRITDKLLSPKYIHEKEYLVRVKPNISNKFIELIQNGVKFDGIISKKCLARRKNKDTFYIILTEGKKRQIRRMCEALHHDVIDLKRIRIMNIMLEDLPEGNYREIKGGELITFLKLLNSKK